MKQEATMQTRNVWKMRLDKHKHITGRYTRLYRILQQDPYCSGRVRRFSLLPPAFKSYIFRGKCSENERENFPFSKRSAKLEKDHLKNVKWANVWWLIPLHFSSSMQIINVECKLSLPVHKKSRSKPYLTRYLLIQMILLRPQRS